MGPRLAPALPLVQHTSSNAVAEHAYDMRGDGRVDYVEVGDTSGPVTSLRFDLDGDGTLEMAVAAPASANGSATDALEATPHLVIILDSIPFDLVREVYEKGGLRLFNPPSRVIAPFPVMTDLALAELFGLPATPAVESQFFDGTSLNSGIGTYITGANSPWLAHVDYSLTFALHGLAYLWPEPWFDHELRSIEDAFLSGVRAKRVTGPFIGYSVATSALGSRLGRDGHVLALSRVDRLCRWIVYETRGHVNITLLSDHGHNLLPSRRIGLPAELTKLGYRMRSSLRGDRDVVFPAWGMITCAVLHTKRPPRLAHDAVGITGVALASYATADEVVVVDSDGEARITKRGDRYRYTPRVGDPLKLREIMSDLSRRGLVDEAGFADEATLFAATAEHTYPDPLRRLWQAFHGLVTHTPDVLLSIENGYYCGNSIFGSIIDLQAAHGSLDLTSSSGFVLTTAKTLPPAIRMDDLGKELSLSGMPLHGEPRSAEMSAP